MQYRSLGSTGYEVSSVSIGCWAIGGSWGKIDDSESLRALHRALDLGVNFFDTADVYGDGHSERLLARLRQERKEPFVVATKAGRRLQPHEAKGYTRDNLTRFVERSLANLGVDSLDLLQLHCPPTDTYYQPETFEALDDLVRQGKVRHYGVSIERVEEGLKALEYPNVKTLQVIYNVFRQRPAERLFEQARARKVGILARVPLASGLLSGRLTSGQRFENDDHRQFNRHGEAFDRGETFSGVDYELGISAARELAALFPGGATLAQWALRWVLMEPAVSCAIPGARRVTQVEENVAAADLAALSPAVLGKVRELYEKRIKPEVHQRW